MDQSDISQVFGLGDTLEVLKDISERHQGENGRRVNLTIFRLPIQIIEPRESNPQVDRRLQEEYNTFLIGYSLQAVTICNRKSLVDMAYLTKRCLHQREAEKDPVSHTEGWGFVFFS